MAITNSGSNNMTFRGGPFGQEGADRASQVVNPGGKVFYVNASNTGTDDVDSPWPDVDEALCFSTLQAAINATVANRGDIIYVKRSEEVSSTVAFNKSGISVISQRFGMDPMAQGEYNAIYAASTLTDAPVATITAGCYIEGLGFAGRDSGTSFFAGAAVLVGGAAAGAFGLHMKNCRFPKWGLDNSIGISFAGGAAISNCLVEDCDFEGAFDAGIYVQGAVGHLQVKGCRFNLMTYAIECGSFADAGVNSQIIIGPGNITVTPTKGILSGSNVCKGMVCGNWWGTAVGTTHDQTVDDMETDGYICAGNYYADEERDDE